MGCETSKPSVQDSLNPSSQTAYEMLLRQELEWEFYHTGLFLDTVAKNIDPASGQKKGHCHAE